MTLDETNARTQVLMSQIEDLKEMGKESFSPFAVYVHRRLDQIEVELNSLNVRNPS